MVDSKGIGGRDAGCSSGLGRRGVLHLPEEPFYAGDYIETGNTEGVIQDITILHTVLQGSASQTIVVPNHQLTLEEVKNYTRETKSAIELTLPTDRLGEGTEFIRETADEHAETLANPELEVVYRDQDGEIAVELHYWLDDAGAAKRVKSEILEAFTERAVAADLFEDDDPAELAA